jgi:prolyl-tRNA synthetase
MKDLYSFSKDVTEHESFYEKAKQAYIDIFKRVGIGDKTYLTYASGGSFSKFSHEFQTETQSGEDLIHVCSKCRVAVNDEIFSEQNKCPVCGGGELIDKKTVEVGNIFNLGTKFSDALSLKYIDETNKEKMVVMGSYGIGPGRLLGTIAEIFGGEKGINWPKEIAPFQAHVIVLGSSNEVLLQRDKVVQSLEGASIEPLVDDRDLSAGEKFSDADLIGVPVRIIVSEKTVKGGEVEIMTGAENKSFVAPEAVLRYFSS